MEKALHYSKRPRAEGLEGGVNQRESHLFLMVILDHGSQCEESLVYFVH